MAASRAGSCYTLAVNSTFISGYINIFGVRAPCFAAAPASSAAICKATASAAPAVAKDGESTGALCHAHNLSSSLPVCPSLLDSRSAKTDTAGAEADSQYESGGGNGFHPLIKALASFSSSAAAPQQFIYMSLGVAACDRLSSLS